MSAEVMLKMLWRGGLLLLPHICQYAEMITTHAAILSELCLCCRNAVNTTCHCSCSRACKWVELGRVAVDSGYTAQLSPTFSPAIYMPFTVVQELAIADKYCKPLQKCEECIRCS